MEGEISKRLKDQAEMKSIPPFKNFSNMLDTLDSCIFELFECKEGNTLVLSLSIPYFSLSQKPPASSQDNQEVESKSLPDYRFPSSKSLSTSAGSVPGPFGSVLVHKAWFMVSDSGSEYKGMTSHLLSTVVCRMAGLIYGM